MIKGSASGDRLTVSTISDDQCLALNTGKFSALICKQKPAKNLVKFQSASKYNHKTRNNILIYKMKLI